MIWRGGWLSKYTFVCFDHTSIVGMVIEFRNVKADGIGVVGRGESNRDSVVQ